MEVILLSGFCKLMQVLRYFTPLCMACAEYVHLLSKRVTAQNRDIQIQKLVMLRQYIKFRKCLCTISPQYFAYNQKNVTVHFNSVFFCYMGIKLALSFCERVKENKLLQSCMELQLAKRDVTTSIRRLLVCDD